MTPITMSLSGAAACRVRARLSPPCYHAMHSTTADITVVCPLFNHCRHHCRMSVQIRYDTVTSLPTSLSYVICLITADITVVCLSIYLSIRLTSHFPCLHSLDVPANRRPPHGPIVCHLFFPGKLSHVIVHTFQPFRNY